MISYEDLKKDRDGWRATSESTSRENDRLATLLGFYVLALGETSEFLQEAHEDDAEMCTPACPWCRRIRENAELQNG